MIIKVKFLNTACQRDTFAQEYLKGRHTFFGSNNYWSRLKVKPQILGDSICKLIFSLYISSGVGANFIYPILAISEFEWIMSGSEVNNKSIEWAEENILRLNPFIKKNFPGFIRLQKDSSKIFEGVIFEEDKFDFSICNPPFFNEEDDRKLRKSSVCPI